MFDISESSPLNIKVVSDIIFSKVTEYLFCSLQGGRHVEYMSDTLVKLLVEVIKKKNKGGFTVKAHQIKQHMWLFINCLIVNPTFDSQTKENMTLPPKSFGVKCNLSEKFVNTVSRNHICLYCQFNCLYCSFLHVTGCNIAGSYMFI